MGVSTGPKTRSAKVANAARPNWLSQGAPVTRTRSSSTRWPRSARCAGGTTEAVCATSAPGSHSAASATTPSAVAPSINPRRRPGRGMAARTAACTVSSAAIMSGSVSSRLSLVSVPGAKTGGVSPRFSRSIAGSDQWLIASPLLGSDRVSVASPRRTRTSRRWSSGDSRHRPEDSSR